MKKQRKFLAVIMCIALITTIVPFTLFASAETVLPYTGQASADTSDGTVYTISSAEDLQTLATKVNAGDLYENVTFRLTCDIDLSSIASSWAPIGNNGAIKPTDAEAYRAIFKGTFDGGNHKVSGLNITDAVTTDDGVTYKTGAYGLFGYVSGTVENLSVCNSEMVFKSIGTIAAPIVASLEKGGKITNCSTYDVSINVDAQPGFIVLSYIGGIAAQSDGKVLNSYSRANLYSAANTSPISYGFVGGIVGVLTSEEATISNCYFTGNATVGSFSTGAVVGGIAAQNDYGTIENCYNVGIVDGALSAAISPYVADGGTVSNCYYLEGTSDVGYMTYDRDTGKFTAPDVDCTTFTSDAPVDASALSDAFSNSLNPTSYPFPVLSATDVTTVPADNTTDFAGGNGTLYNPYLISTTSQLNNVRNYMSSAFKLQNDITFYDYEYNDEAANKQELYNKLKEKNLINVSEVPLVGDLIEKINDSIINIDNKYLLDGQFKNGFPTLGSNTDPFTGSFDGDGKNIFNLRVNGTDNAALFACNRGVIKNFTITTKAVEEVSAPSVTGGEYIFNVATMPSLIVATAVDSEKTAYAAGVAAWNFGDISNVINDADVIVVADSLSMYAGGISAVNSGVIDHSNNTGVIFATYSDKALAEGVDYSTIGAKANIYVAGLVAHNKTNAKITDCKSSDSARSQLTSPSTVDDNINEGQYFAINDGTVNGTSSITTIKNYLDFTVNNISYSNQLSNENPVGDSDYSGNIVNGTTGIPEIAYSNETNHYQKVTMTYTDGEDTYKVDYMVWFKLDIANDDVKVDAKGKDSFLVGDSFSTLGIQVSYKNEDGNRVSLSEVPDYNSNGYVVKLYSDEACTTPVDKASFTSLEAGTYYVRITYGSEDGLLRTDDVTLADKNYTYAVTIYDISSIKASAKYSSYLVGQTPDLTVVATYGDPSATKKSLLSTDYSYELGTVTDETFTKRTSGDATKVDTSDNAIRVFVTIKNGQIKEDVININVVTEADVKVENLTAITSDSSTEANGVTGDNVKLEWDANENVPLYKVYSQVAGTNPASWKQLGTASGAKTGKISFVDSTSAAGKSYDYKIVPVVGGSELEKDSSSAGNITATAAMPTYLTADASKVDKEYVLDAPLNPNNLVVTATYKNGSSEKLSRGAGKASTTSYFIDSSEFDSSTPGTKTVKIYYNNAVAKDQNSDDVAYDVTVLTPNGIKVTKQLYKDYPEGYPEASFKNTITVEYLYEGKTTKSTVTTYTLKDYATISNTVTDSAVSLTVEASNRSTDNPQTLSCTTDVRFVANNPPANLTGTSDNTGVNIIKSDLVTGAVSYKLYRADSEFGEYTEVGKATVTKDNKVEYTDTTAIGGNTYYYKSTAIIADQETDKSASLSVSTTAPKYVKAFWNGRTDYVHHFAIVDDLNTSGVKLYGFYADDIGENTATTVAGYKTVDEWTNAGFETRVLDASVYTVDSSEYVKASAIAGQEYTVTVSYNSSTTYGPTGNTIDVGSFTVIPCGVKAMTVKTVKTKYPKDYTLTSSDLTVYLQYGYDDNGKFVKISEKYAKKSDYTIECPNVGTNVSPRIVTVTYVQDNSITASNTYTVYDLYAIPTGFTAEDSGAGTINLTFTGTVLPADKYVIYKKSENDADFTALVNFRTSDGETIEGVGTIYNYSDADVVTGTQYSYYVLPIYNYNDNGQASDTVNVTLTSAPKLTPTTPSGYSVIDVNGTSYIKAVQPNTTGNTFISNMQNSSYVKVYDKANNLVTTGKVGTGYVAKLYVNEVVVDSKIIIVKGDLNGDAQVNIADAMNIKDSILGKTSLNDIKKIAADINGANNNGDNQINIADFMLIKDYILNKTTIK